MREVECPYEGMEPYIFISYRHDDPEDVDHKRTKPVLDFIEKLRADGYRVWYDKGVTMTKKYQPIVEERMENCHSAFVFLSRPFLESDDCTSELNTLRDYGKNLFLMVLDDLTDREVFRLNYKLNGLTPKHSSDPAVEKYEEIINNERILDECLAPESIPPLKFNFQQYNVESKSQNFINAEKALFENYDPKLACELFRKAYDEEQNNLAGTKLGIRLYVGEGGKIDRTEAVSLFSKMENDNPLDAAWLSDAYRKGSGGLKKDEEKATELYNRCNDALKVMCTMGDPDALQIYGDLLYNRARSDDEKDLAESYINQAAEKHQSEALRLSAKIDQEKAKEIVKNNGISEEAEKLNKSSEEKYKEAADRGNIRAMARLGELYYFGAPGIEKDTEKAVEIYRQAAEGGSDRAQLRLGQHYYGLNKKNKKDYFKYKRQNDDLKAKECLEQAKENFVKAKEYHRLSAFQGNHMAQYYLGNCFAEEGEMEEAVKCWEAANQNGNYNAKLEIANCYDKGIILEKNYEEARKLYEELYYDSNDSIKKMMMHTLGVYYAEGKGGPRDEEKAEECFKEEVRLNLDLKTSLGEQYLKGKGVRRDDKEAVKYFLEDEDHSPRAQYMLGFCYEKGRGVEGGANEEKAIEYYKKAADSNIPDAQLALAECYKKQGKMDLAFKYWKDAAHNGNVAAMLQLAKYYEKNSKLTRAIEWHEKAADHGNEISQYRLAYFYLKGKGPLKKDERKAVELYEKSANQGNEKAQKRMAECCINCIGKYSDLTEEESVKEAAKWYERAAAQGNSSDQFELGQFFEERGDMENALIWYERAKEQRNPRAIERLRNYYESINDREKIKDLKKLKVQYMGTSDAMEEAMNFHLGINGSDKDEESAVEFWKLAAKMEDSEGGDADAQYYLGAAYENGRGIEQNYEEAFHCYFRAAQQGHSDALHNLGMCFEYGNGTDQDVTKAIRCYEAAAEKGIIASHFNLGFCYAKRENPDGEMVRTHWEIAAKNGHVKACFNLGLAYEEGKYGLPIDLEKAIYWYETIEYDRNAQYQLAECLRKSEGPKDWNKILSLYKSAARQAHTAALRRMGEWYFKGRIDNQKLDQNYDNAFKCYKKAADQGDMLAQYYLGICYKEGLGVDTDVDRAKELFQDSANSGYVHARKKLERSGK